MSWWWLHPLVKLKDDGREIRRIAIAQKQRHTARGQQLGNLMQYRLGYGLTMLTDPDAQHQLGFEIDCRPDPPG